MRHEHDEVHEGYSDPVLIRAESKSGIASTVTRLTGHVLSTNLRESLLLFNINTRPSTKYMYSFPDIGSEDEMGTGDGSYEMVWWLCSDNSAAVTS